MTCFCVVDYQLNSKVHPKMKLPNFQLEIAICLFHVGFDGYPRLNNHDLKYWTEGPQMRLGGYQINLAVSCGFISKERIGLKLDQLPCRSTNGCFFCDLMFNPCCLHHMVAVAMGPHGRPARVHFDDGTAPLPSFRGMIMGWAIFEKSWFDV